MEGSANVKDPQKVSFYTYRNSSDHVKENGGFKMEY